MHAVWVCSKESIERVLRRFVGRTNLLSFCVYQDIFSYDPHPYSGGSLTSLQNRSGWFSWDLSKSPLTFS